MHERSLMQSLLEQVEGLMREHGARHVEAIHVGVGELAGVEPELFRLAFDDLAADSVANGAALHLTPIPLVAACRACERRFRPERFHFACPACGSGHVDVLEGEHVILERVVLETGEPAPPGTAADGRPPGGGGQDP